MDKKHKSDLLLELPLIVTSTKGKYDVLKAHVYIIEVEVTFLAGRKLCKNWGSILEYQEKCIRNRNKVDIERL